MRMFPYTAARVKADIQRAACTDIGMHTPALWQKVTVCVTSLVSHGIPHALPVCCAHRSVAQLLWQACKHYLRQLKRH